MEIKILGTGCSNCKSLEKATREAVAELNLDASVVKEEDIVKIMGYGVMRTPAYNGRQDPYDVLLVTKKMLGSGVNTSVFTSYRHKTG